MVLPIIPGNPMSVSLILGEFGITAGTTKRISNDLFPLVGGTAGLTCLLGASFSGKSAGVKVGYSTIRGNNADVGYGITVDSVGNIYVTGQYISTTTVPINTFGAAPTASGVSLPISSGTTSDAFVIKWLANGTVAGYSTIKGSNADIGQSIAVDSSGNIYVTGEYNSTTTVPINTFGTAPTASGVSLPIRAGTVTDAFVIKWLANGTVAGYSTVRSISGDIGYGITVDSSQNIYITGYYSAPTATVPLNTFGTNPTASGVILPVSVSVDAFVIKWLANGTVAGYTTIRGNNGADTGHGIAVDSSGNIYITGYYTSSGTVPINTFGTAPTSSGVSLPITVGGNINDAFVIKWNGANGSVAGYSTIMGTGNTGDVGRGIAVDSSQNIYVTGQYFSSTVTINTFGTNPTASGVSLPTTVSGDVFVIKWLANGTVAGYSTINCGGNADTGHGIAVDSSGNIYVLGQYNSTTTVPINTFGTAPTGTGVSLPISVSTDVFVIKWNGSDGSLAGYTNIKGSANDIGYDIAVDSAGNIYVTGQYISTSTVPINTFSTTPAASGFSLPIATATDAFVIKWIP
jgi:hypothetical protein